MEYRKENPPPYGAAPYGPAPYGPAPPQGPPPMMGAPPPSVVYPMTFGPDSQTLVCPSCHTNINSSVRKESTTKTHLFALLLCIICCPLVCLPYCIDSCQASNHYCPKCGAYLGTYDS
ncbi:hypothetical protein O3M35_006779 [Rhynocoris fuscipes]|uniref:LITAF domain-containing protein n=1 Tax=Rhynocoris fuscipes TaxID=488301 RepID=A0AAW1DH15_9HEMI